MGPWRYDYFVLVKQKLLTLCVLLVGFCMPSEGVSAHSGGTDKYGCHGGSRSYHCHNSGPSINSRSKISSGQNKIFLQHLKLNGLNAKAKFRVVLKRHETCESLNNLYLRGVAVSKQVLSGGMSRALTLVSQPLYEINRHLDTNNNGIACGFLEPENFRIRTFLCGQVKFVPEPWSPYIDSKSSYSHCESPDPALGGWKIEVVYVTPNAETAILAESSEYFPARDGYWYFLVKLRITNLNPGKEFFPERQLGLMGPKRSDGISSFPSTVYRHGGCGDDDIKWDYTDPDVEPYNDKSILSVFEPNESRLANFCWDVMASDVAGGLLLFFEQEIQVPSENGQFSYPSTAYSYIDMWYKKP